MTRSLEVRPEAEADLAGAIQWYNEQRAGLGRVFLSQVRQTIRRIKRNPEAFAPLYQSVRGALVSRFPYVVYFHISGELISVLAVLHGHRDPATWQSRFPEAD
jgi:plasmid stabilization system protein ParE